MNRRQALKYSFLNLFIIILGAFIAFKVWWAHDEARFFGIVAFFLIAFGSLFLSISLTRIIIPIQTDFSFSTLSDRNQYQILKTTIGTKKVKILNSCYISLFFILFAGTAYGLVTSLNNYEQYQLKAFGCIQKVKINDIHSKGKGMPYAFFDFYLNGEKYSNDLTSKNYRVGDTATIIFSTQNPDIILWAHDFDARKE